MNLNGMEQLSAGTLAAGRALEGLNEALGRAVKDLVERPELLTNRTVTLTVTFKPDPNAREAILNGGPDVNIPTIDYSVDLKLPKMVGASTKGIVSGGGLYVSMHEPEAPEQTNILTLPNVLGAEG